jgi:hypothetical protein
MLGFGRKARFDPDTLSSIWVLACRDESPVLTTYSIAYRLGGVTPEQAAELVKSRRELFRLGLTAGQARHWKEQFRRALEEEQRPPEPKPAAEGGSGKPGEPKSEERRVVLPDWLRVFDDEGSEDEQKRVREWLGDDKIGSSRQALDRFLDQGFVIDESVVRSRFRDDPELKAPPSDLQTVNWGLEHIDRLRRGRAETRQQLVALTTGIGGVAIGAFVALTAPMVTTIYQGRPLDTNRLTFEHQARVEGYAALGTAVGAARRANATGDARALADSLTEAERAATRLHLLLDGDARESLRGGRATLADACAQPGQGCAGSLDEMQGLLDGLLAQAAAR